MVLGEWMTEEDKLFYTIGEVAQIVDVKPYVLRYWETEFRKLNPQKSVTGQRVYRQKDLQIALTIKRLLYDEQYTIAGAVKKLEELEEKQGLDSPQASTGAGSIQAETIQPVSPIELSTEEHSSSVQRIAGHPSSLFSSPDKVLELKTLITSTREILKKYNLA